MGRSVLVTGAAGYLGNLVTAALARHPSEISCLVAHDIKAHPGAEASGVTQFVQGDVRSPEIGGLLKRYEVDTVVHLASIVSPGKDSRREAEYSVDVLGTENLLKAAVRQGVRQFVITSSGAAYGYHADNPASLDENDAIRGNEAFAYSCHKRLVEEMLARYRAEHPGMKQLVLRPGTILGKQTNNQITALFRKRFVLGISGSDSPFVFVWDEDVAEIIVKGVLEQREGIFNIAGDGCLTVRQIAEHLHKPLLRVPAGLLKAALRVLHTFGISRYGPEQIDFLRYRPVLSNKKLKSEFGYVPRMNSAEVFDYYIRHNVPVSSP